MGVILFSLLTALVHLAVFVSYPETGPLGSFFLFMSIIIWTALYGFSSMVLTTLKRSTLLFIYTIILMVSILSGVVFLPQADNVSVFDKVALGHYPAKLDVYRGLLRLGIDYTPFKPPPPKIEPDVV